MCVVPYPLYHANASLKEKVSEQTAPLRSETLETIDSQTQPERLYEGLPNKAELERDKKKRCRMWRWP